MASKFEVLLEKKGRGRGAFTLSRPWAVRTFKLVGQTLEYYDVDKLKGTIDIGGSSARRATPEESDNKPFPFEVDTGKEKLMLNASCEEIRTKCLEVFGLASKSADWDKKPVVPVAAAPQKNAGEALAALAAAEENRAKLAKLEEEQKKLETERLKQQTAVAAKVMEEELANKKIREAKEAEARQREEQQRQAMELLKGMGAKARFFAALKAGQHDIAEAAAAVMLQGAWRAKCARRRMLLKKAEKERLREEGYAKKIQCRYRARLARKKVEAIKIQKLQNRKQIGALKFQCTWRIYSARKIFAKKQELNLAAHYNKSVSRQRSIIKLQNFFRASIAWRRVALLAMNTPTIASVTVTSADGLNVYNPAIPCDPAVIVSGVTLDMPRDSPAITKLNYTVPEEVVKAHGKATSHFRSEALSLKKTALVSASNRLDFIVITLVDRNTPNKDDCIGQAHVRVSDIRRKLAKGQTSIELTIPLGSAMTLAVTDVGGAAVTLRRALTGSITATINIADPRYSACGWLWKVSESLLSNAWKKRWFVLADGQLTYYNSEFALDQPKHTILGTQITAIGEEQYKGRNATKISYTWENTDTFWQLDFDEEAPPAMKSIWLRRLYRVASNVTDPYMMDLHNKFKISKSSSKVGDATTTSPLPKTRAPVSKRMSIFK